MRQDKDNQNNALIASYFASSLSPTPNPMGRRLGAGGAIHPVRDKNDFNLFLKYRLPMPDFNYFSRAKASFSFKQAS
jgi:hypothetical protein